MNLILLSAAIVSMLICIVGFALNAKADKVIRFIFKDKITYTPKAPLNLSRVKKGLYKGRCPVCGTKVSSKKDHKACCVCGQKLNWRKIKQGEIHNQWR